MVGTAAAIIITVVVLAAVAAVAWILYSRFRAQKLGLPPPALTSFIPFRSKPEPFGPTPRPGGIQGWFGDQVTKFKNRNNRTAAGAYEGGPGPHNSNSSNTARGLAVGAHPSANRSRSGFGALDPDAAWDARVGDETGYGPAGYDEEHELGLGPYGRNSTAYDGAAHGGRGGPLGGSLSVDTDPGEDEAAYATRMAASPRVAAAMGDAGGGRGGDDGDGAYEGARGRRAVRQNPFDDDAAEPSNISLRDVSPRPMSREQRGKDGDDSPTGRRSIFTEDV